MDCGAVQKKKEKSPLSPLAKKRKSPKKISLKVTRSLEMLVACLTLYFWS